MSARRDGEKGVLLPSLLGLGALLLAPPCLADLPLDLTVRNALPEARSRAPVTWGVPFGPEDALTDPGSVSLLRGGVPVPFQASVSARWAGAPADASRPVAWLLLDLSLDLAASETARLQLVRTPPAGGSSPLRVVRNDASAVVVETGAATYTVGKAPFRLLDRVVLADGTAFAGSAGILFTGSPLTAAASVEVEVSGPQRITLKAKGTVQGDLGYTARLHFTRDLAEVKVDFRLENLSGYALRNEQPDCNDYGTPGSVAFDDLTLVFPAGPGKDYRFPGGERGAGAEVSGAFATALSLVQESSGEERWDALRGEAPRLQSGVTKRASTVAVDGVSRDGANQLGGWLDSGGVTVAVPRLWESFPKALRARNGGLEAGLFPGEFSRDHQLRAGEFKTHTVWVRHHAPAAADVGARARSALAPLRLLAPADAVARTRAADLFAPRLGSTFPLYEKGLDYQVTESPEYAGRPWESSAPHVLSAISFAQLRGWVDDGDVPTDFEPFDATGLSSPFNLKYDTVRGMVQQALRSDDETWWSLAGAAARHAADVDVLHSRSRGRSAPRGWPDGGMYGHGYHDERGNVNPHRNYMNPSMSMTGPPPGMFLWAHLTGDTLLLDSALEVAEAVWWRTVNSAYADDGGCASGLRKCTLDPPACLGFEEADGSRTGAHVVKTMLSAYLATGERAYLDLIQSLAAYLDCREARTGLCCSRHHIQTTVVTALGHYLLFRQWNGLGDDAPARSFVRRRVDYVRQRLWNPAAGTFSMCYGCPDDPDPDDCDETRMCSYNDNWLFSLADSVALGSLVLDDPALLTGVARPMFDAGSPHPFGGDSTLAYHFTKELANQVGYGSSFAWAWWRSQAAPAGCTSDGQTLCLNQSRFQVRATWRDYAGNSGAAQAVALTNDTGYFWFFGRDNVEVVVKALDFCGTNGRWALYAAGLTDVEIALTVTDTRNAASKSYANGLGVPFVLVRDAPFACP